MLEDNLNKKKLTEMIGDARFNTPEEFKDFLKDKIQENFLIDHKRTLVKKMPEAKRFDLHILDNLTKREVLIVIGLKTVSATPQITPEDIEVFHKDCQAVQALYGVLMTETEVYFYEYKKEGPTKIPEIQPLNYIDAEFERKMTPKKYKDYLIAHKYWVIAIVLIVILMIASSLAQAKICKTSGPIKAEVKSTGEKVYFLPETTGYSGRTTGDQPGERRYCDEKDAISDGFKLTK
ncbi:hypothetical protein KJ657_03325 [Patescibacteria group bacterium]|nr:hypothetical protein [Patescibacteria group bacterium]MBU1016096.1 hypothetical protein [Patescibacteria group bacterium]MBU1684839.1 hypothetical protein [Patescibacteria group bacterium]MBU1938555.1 hypothetical protein [Patescibacteria group bacterium]